MPFRPKGSDWWKTRITLDQDRSKVFACGTTNEGVANDVERMVRTFEHDRRWKPLEAVYDRRKTLGEIYDAHKNDSLDDLLAVLDAPDLSLLVDEWPAKTEKYRKQVRGFIPKGPRFPVTDFNKTKIAAYLDALEVSGSTKNRHHTAIQQFGKWLVRKNVIDSNIVRDVERANPNTVEPRHLSRDEAKVFIAGLPLPYKALEALMAAFGAEWQVIERATRKDADLKAPSFWARGGKTKWRNRLARPTELWAWRIFTQYAKDFGDDELLFAGIREDVALRVHKRIAKELGLPFTTLHDWRHTYAVQARKDGYSDAAIAHNLGHKDTTLVQTRYGRHTPRLEDFVPRHARRPPSKPRRRAGKKRAKPRRS